MSRCLAEAKTTQSAVAESLNVTAPYVSQVLGGKKRPSPQWIDLMADTLKLSDDRRQELHRSAALDAGYKLDLSK